MSRWRLHLVIQLFTFAVFPAVGLALAATFGRWMPASLTSGYHRLQLLVCSALAERYARRAEPGGGDVHAPLTRRPGN